jgi:quercetin dioxygenase-like cupin family protein
MKIELHKAPVVMASPEGRNLFASEKLGIVHLTLKNTESIEPHANPFDVIFFVLEGTGILTIEGENMECPAGTLVDVKAGMQRNWRNPGEALLKLLVIKSFA